MNTCVRCWWCLDSLGSNHLLWSCKQHPGVEIFLLFYCPSSTALLPRENDCRRLWAALLRLFEYQVRLPCLSALMTFLRMDNLPLGFTDGPPLCLQELNVDSPTGQLWAFFYWTFLLVDDNWRVSSWCFYFWMIMGYVSTRRFYIWECFYWTFLPIVMGLFLPGVSTYGR